MCRDAALDIWPDGHSICKAPVPAAPGNTPTPSKWGNCLIFLRCVLDDSFALLDMCRFAARCGVPQAPFCTPVPNCFCLQRMFSRQV